MPLRRSLTRCRLRQPTPSRAPLCLSRRFPCSSTPSRRPVPVFSSTVRTSRASEFGTRDEVRSLRYPVGPRRADTRKAAGRGLFVEGGLAWRGEQSRPLRAVSIAPSYLPPDAVNDSGNELVFVGSRRDGLRVAVQAA